MHVEVVPKAKINVLSTFNCQTVGSQVFEINSVPTNFFDIWYKIYEHVKKRKNKTDFNLPNASAIFLYNFRIYVTDILLNRNHLTL